MINKLQLFPLLDAHEQLQGYITDPDLNVRVVLLSEYDEVWIHITPKEFISPSYLWEQADHYGDDISDWFSHLNVTLIEKDSDWFIIRVRT